MAEEEEGRTREEIVSPKRLSLIQVNLHRAEVASAALCETFARRRLDIALIQEPWAGKGKIRGIPTTSGKLIYCREAERCRAAILINGSLSFMPIPEFISSDLVAVILEERTDLGSRRTVLASAYFPGEEREAPPPEIGRLLDYCEQRNLHVLIGCDANAHHTLWGSTDINSRGELLLDFLTARQVTVLNRGSEPTFVTSSRKEVLDLTLSSTFVADRVTNWHVSDEVSLSDHRYIIFNLEFYQCIDEKYRIPKNTNWDLYRDILKHELEGLDGEICTPEELDSVTTRVQAAIIKAYEESCELITKKSNRDAPWWSCKLGRLRTLARRFFNRAKRTGEWDTYRRYHTGYTMALRRAKRSSWRNFCEGLEEVSAVARLQKVLSRDRPNQIGLLQKADGSYTNDVKETLELLMGVHFPGSTIIAGEQHLSHFQDADEVNRLPNNRILKCAKKIFTSNKVKWAIKSFKPYKSPGGDGIFPALLQQGLEVIVPIILKTYIASYTLEYIPKMWRRVRVVFIPKAGKTSSTQPKSQRPISLTSFLLKAMEKIIGQMIRDDHLEKSPIAKAQHAYQKGKSTESALSETVSLIERALDSKEIALCCFLDIGGAFDNTNYVTLERAARKKGISDPTIQWIKAMLMSRVITTSQGGESITVLANRGCPQGGVLSPLLWLLVADELLDLLSQAGYETVAYADDFNITVRGKFDCVVSNRMQGALNIVKKWCDEEGLHVNPEKTILVPFTNRRKLSLIAPKLHGQRILFSKEVKYLGVVLDHKLTWNKHIEHILNKGTRALWACHRMLGKTWGLTPKLAMWSYKAVVRPMVTYASVIWWRKTYQATAQLQLTKLQRLACLGITGAMSTSPTAALEVLLDLTPLPIFVQRTAFLGATRMLQMGRLKSSVRKGSHLEILAKVQTDPVAMSVPDLMPGKMNFDLPFRVIINDRECWKRGMPQFEPGSLLWFTDGSVMNGRAGLGVKGPNFSLAKPLGTTATIYQAETHAIEICAQEITRKRLKGARIYILSDSQAALKAIASFTISSKLTWDCLNSLRAAARGNKLTLLWVPGHEGVEGNEAADLLAKQGSESLPCGPEPLLGVTKSFLTLQVKKWEDIKRAAHWRNTPKQRQAKRLITISTKRAKALLSLRRKDLRTLTGLLTGHCPLRYHLSKMGKVRTEECRLCCEEVETAEHILCECSAVASARFRHFGKGILVPPDVSRATPETLLHFVREEVVKRVLN